MDFPQEEKLIKALKDGGRQDLADDLQQKWTDVKQGQGSSVIM